MTGLLAAASTWRLRVFGLLLVLSLLPVVAVDIPAGVDVPNHLARMRLLTEGTGSHPFYDIRWDIYPNLAMDLLVPVLAKVLSVEAAVKVFYLAGQVLVVTGAAAIEVVHKGRFDIAGFTALGLLYSLPFAWGFMNFTFGCGVGLWGIALHMLSRDRPVWVRLLVHATLVVLLFVAHFFALGVYGIVVGLLELARWWHSRRIATQLMATAAWLAAPMIALLVVLHSSTANAFSGEGYTTWMWAWKPIYLLMSVNGYSWPLSAALTAGVIVLVYLLVRHRALAVDPLGRWVAVGLAIAFLAMPFRVFNTAYADVRVVVAAGLILPSFLSVTHVPSQLRKTIISGAVALLLVNVGFVTYGQLSYDRSYRQLLASFRHIQPGSRVLVGITATMGGIDPPIRLLDYPMYNAPVLAVSHRDAFVPTLFTAPGKQPLVVRPGVRHLDIPYGTPVPVAKLRSIATGTASPPLPRFMAHWRLDYDYLVLLGEESPRLMPNVLERLDGGDRFTLYRIR